MNASTTPTTLTALREKIETLERTEKLSLDDALMRTNEIVEIAQQAAASLEEAGDMTESVAVYKAVAAAVEKTSEKLQKHEQELFAPLVNFWTTTAELKQVSLPTTEERAADVLRPQWTSYISVKGPHSDPVKATSHDKAKAAGMSMLYAAMGVKKSTFEKVSAGKKDEGRTARIFFADTSDKKEAFKKDLGFSTDFLKMLGKDDFLKK